MTTPTPDLLTRAVDSTLASNASLVIAWLKNEPGSWGKLAGAGVIVYRRLLGRPLTDGERRQLWAKLWGALQERRQT